MIGGGFLKKNYKLTMFCSFGGCLVQAMVINYLPLLFVVFQENFGLSLQQVTLLVTINFIVQLTVDFLAAFFIDRIGYKVGVIAALIFMPLEFKIIAFLLLLIRYIAVVIRAHTIAKRVGEHGVMLKYFIFDLFNPLMMACLHMAMWRKDSTAWK